MNFYFKDCIDEFAEVCKFIDLKDEEIRHILNMATHSTPRTWQVVAARNHADVIGNWFFKELNRSGDSTRDSNRRCDLYKQRRGMLNYKDSMHLRSISPDFCKATGHPINYGLGVTKEIYNKYFLKKYGMIGISPSIERTDPNKGYVIDNIEIISNMENIGRNMSVNTDHLRKVQQIYKNLTQSVPRQVELLRLLQTDKIEVSFVKINNEKRVMNATLNLDMIPKESHPKGEKKSPSHIINVWDLDKQAWRSFSYHKLKKVKL
jgi:hypothetical protein